MSATALQTGAASAEGRPLPADPAALQPGDTVLDVLLAAPLGVGNVTRVWSGLDGERPVALKIFDPARAEAPGASAAFARGAAAGVRLCAGGAPPGVLPVFRSSPDGLTLVTALAEGDLNDLTALSWTPPQIVPFFELLCRAVQGAHEAGVIHGGLKPSNVFVSDSLEPLVADFGLTDLPSLVAASPDAGGHGPYAAPEALAGEGVLGASADVYSLGRVLYFLLLGRDPDEPVAEVPALFPLSSSPQGLVRIIRRCTARDPAARYQDVAALLHDLERHGQADVVGMAGPVFEPGAGRRLVDVLDAAPNSQRGARAFDDAGPISTRGGNPSVRGSIPAARPSSPGRGSSPGLELEDAPISGRPSLSRLSDAGAVSLRGSTAYPEGSGASTWLPRRAEQALAGAGAFLLVALALWLALSPIPSQGLLLVLRYGAAVGVALLTLALPRFSRRLVPARLAFAALACVLVHLVDASQLVTFRLRASLAAADPAVRAGAARLLVREGHRDLSNRDLSDLDLSYAELSVASFRGANLARANLTGAALTESTFDGADLTGALAHQADLSATNADAAEGWAMLLCDEHTRLPDPWACAGGHPARMP
ncbi:protein kinase domain-containing protein [Chondromyces crocatus]|uniref:Protein kinase domain-containing protein n=1 Tax=Chondromyces crocatus TaxID=52 RepID=A0A0K1EPN9_CHOCO|nr:pentapeptide repeat-containing protein [Chondromyces crocatus]AKT42568.1 uncharacterized protein CMC5_067950 [Chondromyces crocatus]